MINEFFDRSFAELKDSETGLFCNMEQPLKSPNLPVFSNKSIEYFCLNDFKNMHNHEKELTNMIIDHDNAKETDDKNIEVEHMSINFEMLIIAEKIRAIEQGNDPKKLTFDDLYFSNLMIDQEETN